MIRAMATCIAMSTATAWADWPWSQMYTSGRKRTSVTTMASRKKSHRGAELTRATTGQAAHGDEHPDDGQLGVVGESGSARSPSWRGTRGSRWPPAPRRRPASRTMERTVASGHAPPRGWPVRGREVDAHPGQEALGDVGGSRHGRRLRKAGVPAAHPQGGISRRRLILSVKPLVDRSAGTGCRRGGQTSAHQASATAATSFCSVSLASPKSIVVLGS